MKVPVLPVLTRTIASLLLVKTNTVAQEAKNVETRVADTVEKDISDLANRQTLEKYLFFSTLVTHGLLHRVMIMVVTSAST